MKNFLRALRVAWGYRGRLILSLACASTGAVLWGLMFTCIDPVLYILKNGNKPDNNLQARQEAKIAEADAKVKELVPQIDTLTREQADLDDAPPSPLRDKRRRDVALALDKFTRKLETARSDLRWLHFSKKYIDEFMPTDAFTTLVWLFAFVVGTVALRGVFEFGQESLVGSVVNRSLYDLRNRFFRNVIHLDVNQFGEQGSGEMMARFTNDMELVGQGMKTLFGRVVAEPLKAVSCVAFACWISWQLTLMFLVLVPVALFILTKVGRMMKRADAAAAGAHVEHLQDPARGLPRHPRRQGVHERGLRAPPLPRRDQGLLPQGHDGGQPRRPVRPDHRAARRRRRGAGPARGGLPGAGRSAEEKLLGIRMSNHPLEAEELLQLYAYLAAIADPVRKLSSVYTRMQSGFAAGDRIFDFLDRRPHVRANSDGRRLEAVPPGHRVPRHLLLLRLRAAPS